MEITLQELTGQESGILIYGSEIIVTNWSDADTYELPMLFAASTVNYQTDVWNVSQPRKTEDILSEIPGGAEVIYDANGDMAVLLASKEKTAGVVYNITAGNMDVVVIAPDGWN